jgi:hypothetical protein
MLEYFSDTIVDLGGALEILVGADLPLHLFTLRRKVSAATGKLARD